MAELAMLSDR